MKALLALVACATSLLTVLGVVIIPGYRWDVNCAGYLERAANASSVEYAESALGTAVAYLEKEGVTNGWSHVLLKTPDCDVGYWYRNLVVAREDLRKVPEGASQLERSNQLMKLREVLTEDAESGTKVSDPPNIAVFPHQVFWELVFIGSIIAFVVSVIVLKVETE